MKGLELQERIVQDLQEGATGWHVASSEQNRQTVHVYVSENVEAINALIDVAYSGLDESERRSLQKQHRELDASAIDDGFRSITDGIVSNARHWGDKANDPIRAIFALNQDNIQMLLRVLRYAHYADCSAVEFELKGSPIRFT